MGRDIWFGFRFFNLKCFHILSKIFFSKIRPVSGNFIQSNAKIRTQSSGFQSVLAVGNSDAKLDHFIYTYKEIFYISKMV